MFKRILIANRGEIAVRVFRACRELDIEPVVVYSEADREALHVQLAEHAYCIGPAPSAKSYLDVNAILTVAKAAHCDAIHPGYGFLSENADFAQRCADEGIAFIGPSAQVISTMGNKAAARELMKSAGVPVVPGSDGSVADVAEAHRIADEIGYPVLIKAAAGGGGRGMRKVFDPAQFDDLFEEARAEARACFNDDEMYLEKLVLNPHHIEFQIMADSQGNVVQLGERDCSIQRRGQKMIEETPARVLTPELRERMGAAAVAAARAAGYQNAGTIEFVLDPSGEFYFIEMNTRIQVEHPITECVTGIDLVREQIRVASGLTPSTCAATPSSAASTPRTPRTASCPRPASSTSSTCPAATACASTPGCTPAASCLPTTTRWRPSSSCGRPRASRPSAACAAASRSS